MENLKWTVKWTSHMARRRKRRGSPRYLTQHCALVEAITITNSNSVRVDSIDGYSSVRSGGIDRNAHGTYRQHCSCSWWTAVDSGAIGVACDVEQTATEVTAAIAIAIDTVLMLSSLDKSSFTIATVLVRR
jgi:hypothetical protein